MLVLIPNAVNIENNNPHKDVICRPQLFLSVKTKKVKNQWPWFQIRVAYGNLFVNTEAKGEEKPNYIQACDLLKDRDSSH